MGAGDDVPVPSQKIGLGPGPPGQRALQHGLELGGCVEHDTNPTDRLAAVGVSDRCVVSVGGHAAGQGRGLERGHVVVLFIGQSQHLLQGVGVHRITDRDPTVHCVVRDRQHPALAVVQVQVGVDRVQAVDVPQNQRQLLPIGCAA